MESPQVRFFTMKNKEIQESIGKDRSTVRRSTVLDLRSQEMAPARLLDQGKKKQEQTTEIQFTGDWTKAHPMQPNHPNLWEHVFRRNDCGNLPKQNHRRELAGTSWKRGKCQWISEGSLPYGEKGEQKKPTVHGSRGQWSQDRQPVSCGS